MAAALLVSSCPSPYWSLASCQAAFLDSPKSNCLALTGAFQGISLLFGPERDQEGAGLSSVFQQCLSGRCLLNYTLYTALSTCVPTAQQHLCIWLFSKQTVISWDGIEYIPLEVICQRITLFHAKEGCTLIVFIMHSDQSHGKMEPKQYSKSLLPKFSNILKYLFTIHFDNFPGSF